MHQSGKPDWFRLAMMWDQVVAKERGEVSVLLIRFEGRDPGRFPEVLDVDDEPKLGVKVDPKDYACLER